MKAFIVSFSILLNGHVYASGFPVDPIILILFLLWPLLIAVPLTIVTAYKFIKKKPSKIILLVTICFYLLAIVLFFYRFKLI